MVKFHTIIWKVLCSDEKQDKEGVNRTGDMTGWCRMVQDIGHTVGQDKIKKVGWDS